MGLSLPLGGRLSLFTRFWLLDLAIFGSLSLKRPDLGFSERLHLSSVCGASKEWTSGHAEMFKRWGKDKKLGGIPIIPAKYKLDEVRYRLEGM